MGCLFGKNSGNCAVFNLIVLSDENSVDCLEIIFSLENSQFICRKTSIDMAMANVMTPRIVTMSPQFFDVLEQYNKHLLQVINLLSEMVHYVDVTEVDKIVGIFPAVWGVKQGPALAKNPYYRYSFVINDLSRLPPMPKYFLYDPLAKRLDQAEELDDAMDGIFRRGGTARGIKNITSEQNNLLLGYFPLRNIVYRYLKDLALSVIRGAMK